MKINFSENEPYGGIRKPNDLLVAHDLWRRKYFMLKNCCFMKLQETIVLVPPSIPPDENFWSPPDRFINCRPTLRPCMTGARVSMESSLQFKLSGNGNYIM